MRLIKIGQAKESRVVIGDGWDYSQDDYSGFIARDRAGRELGGMERMGRKQVRPAPARVESLEISECGYFEFIFWLIGKVREKGKSCWCWNRDPADQQ